MRNSTMGIGGALAVFALAACGTDEKTPPADNPGTIVAVASANADFSTLVSAIQAAGLVDTLNGAGPFTVFAPTNAAFAKLPAGALNALLADKPALEKLLKFHVVPGKVLAADVVKLTEATTVEGEKISIRVENGVVFINDSKVTMTDVPASNGVIHVIDTVLSLPTPAPGNIVAVASANADFSTLVSAIQAAGLAGTLSGPGPFTVFAPTNAAFAALPAGTLQALLANVPELTKILTYHVVAGRLDAAAVSTATRAVSVQGAEIKIRVENGAVFVNQAKVTMTDIAASNGIIHVIDAVITPPTVVALAQAAPDLSTLVTAIGVAQLTDTLNGPGPFTVFAPVNSAFAALPAGTLNTLLANPAQLTPILTYHVVPQRLLAADVLAAATLPTVNGSTLTVSNTGGVPRINNARIIATDIIGGNGVVHLIDGVLLP
ncbi:MAG: fasciclin domain-containing protein [Myxococcota bacterium]